MNVISRGAAISDQDGCILTALRRALYRFGAYYIVARFSAHPCNTIGSNYLTYDVRILRLFCGVIYLRM